MVVDRLEAPGGTHTADLAQVGRGLARTAGWNLVLVVVATAGLFAFFSKRTGVDGRRRGALVALLIGAPIAATLLSNLAFPVFTGPLVLGAPGIALAVGAAAPLLPQARERLWAGVGFLLLASVVAIAVRLSSSPSEDWRALASAVRNVRTFREVVVVIPERSRPAFTYYARYVPILQSAHGSGAWLAVVASTSEEAVELARPWVSTPRYALLRQVRYGNELRLQHWVRP